MPSWAPAIERWRDLVASEAPDLPIDLVLAIIRHESGGRAGVQSKAKTGCADLPSVSGPRRACRALGLMQVIPRNVASWNSSHPDQRSTWETMTGDTVDAARMQIRIGASILRAALARLHATDPIAFPWPAGPASDDQIKIGLMIYAYGWGHLSGPVAALRAQGAQPTAAEIGAAYPALGKPRNDPIGYSRRVWAWAFGPGAPPERPRKKTGDGGGGAGILIAIALFALWGALGGKG